MAIKAIIFDFGGVLLRTEDHMPRERLAERVNMDRPELEEFVFGGDSGEKAQKGEISTEQHGENLRYQLGYTPQEFSIFLEEFFLGDRLDEELVNYVRSLRKVYKTALLSNSTDDLRHKIEEKWHFEDAFDIMVISGEIGEAKPAPRIFQLALEKLGVAPGEAIFVDDFQRNIEAAEQVGMHGIRFLTSQQVREDIDKVLNGRG